MGLGYVVVTSVTRDDLSDGGAGQFVQTIREIHRHVPCARIEVLVPDFQGSEQALKMVMDARPDVLNHNLETVPRLYPSVRPGADFFRSLGLIRRAGELASHMAAKSGLMLGLGEESGEVREVLLYLLEVNCQMLTLGQYLQPTREHLPVERFIPPEEFEAWRQTALEMGFSEVASGPFVRSSYHAEELHQRILGIKSRLHGGGGIEKIYDTISSGEGQTWDR
jgi:lipoic acid synthetase